MQSHTHLIRQLHMCDKQRNIQLISSSKNRWQTKLCKYNTGGDPPDYINIGEQKEVQCDISQDGKIALVYPVHKYNPDVPGAVSRVTLECNNNSQAAPEFTLTDEDNMIFNLKSYCGCINQCRPSPIPTMPGPTTPSIGPTTPSTVPTTPSTGPETPPTGPETPSTGPETPSTGPGDLNSNWELKILLPSLLGALVVVIFVCLWMRLPVIQRDRLCRCCHCHEQNRDPPREERIVPVTETSALISNHGNDRAVEHEYAGVKGKLNEPVQEEDRDVKGENKSPGKDYRTVVV